MAGPVSGISGQQNFPASNAVQANENTNTRQNVENVEPQENEVTPQEAPASGAQESNENTSQSSSSQSEKGSVVDITV